MYADGVEVFHTAHGNRVALAVADNFEFDFFPSAYALLYEYLMNRGRPQTVFGNLQKLVHSICDSAARTAESKRGTDNNGQADFFGNSYCVFYIVDDFGRYRRLAYLGKRILEHLSVFCLVNRIGARTEKFYAHLVEETVLGKLHT